MIRNLLLDMGGVILDVDYTKIISGFDALGVDASKVYTQAMQMPFVDKFEIGRITPKEFCSEIRKLLNKDFTDQQIIEVWNSMILDVRKSTIDLLKEIKQHYNKLLLFSNTNETHMQFVRKDFKEKLGFDIFTELFDRSYLSNEIHYRKPDKEAFLFVLKDANINANETLFIDDTEKNIIGAKRVGLNAYLIKKDETLIDIHKKGII